MPSQWYYSRDGKDYGPVSSAELKSLAASRQLRKTDLLWREGMAEWKTAGQIPNLFPEEDAPAIVVSKEPAETDPFAPLKINFSPAGKKGVKAKARASVAESLDSLKVDVATAGQKAASKVKSHARTAGKVAALSAERAKISTITLPIAYAELGEHCYRSRTHAEEFAELFTKLDAVSAEIGASEQPTEAGGDTIAEKAKAWAEQGMKLAQSQAQRVQAKTLFVQLGKACFNRFGSESGPEEVVTKIRASRDLLSKLDAEVKTGVSKTGGAKGWLIYGGGALVCLMMIGSCFSEKDPGGGGGGPTSSLTEVEREAYQGGRDDGVSMGRQSADAMRDLIKQGGHPMALKSMKESLEETAYKFMEMRDGAIEAVENFERGYGKPCDSHNYLTNRGRCKGLFDGYMSEVGKYLR